MWILQNFIVEQNEKPKEISCSRRPLFDPHADSGSDPPVMCRRPELASPSRCEVGSVKTRQLAQIKIGAHSGKLHCAEISLKSHTESRQTPHVADLVNFSESFKPGWKTPQDFRDCFTKTNGCATVFVPLCLGIFVLLSLNHL